jgi:cyclopropane-fatty-acyl-phospholipid synthase
MLSMSIHSERTTLLDQTFRNYRKSPFSIRTFDGWSWRSSKTDQPVCTIAVKTPQAWRTLVRNPSELSLGEAFIEGDLDIEGDIFAVFPIADHLFSLPLNLEDRAARMFREWLSYGRRFCRQGLRHSQSRDRQCIASHYDQPSEFYSPWLGDGLVYSCAYFRRPSESLAQAQRNKLELICRKLQLREGDRFLDIGCGWGSLILHAALEYGAEARGITLSRAQAALATHRITEAGMERRCTVEFRDYRETAQMHQSFDKIASVGMFEHVGLSNLRRYFAAVLRMLKPGGSFLNHGIARAVSSPPHKASFIDAHVFPDGELVPLNETIRVAESAGFEVRDVENLREHYVRTLHLWVQGMQQNARTILRTTSQKTYRPLRCAHADTGDAKRTKPASPSGRGGPVRDPDWQ